MTIDRTKASTTKRTKVMERIKDRIILEHKDLVQSPQDDDDTHIDENGVRQPNPPRVNMLKLVNHIEANKGGKHLKFPTASHPMGP